MNPLKLYEAYSAVYDEDLREDLLSVEEDFSFIDDLSDNELDEIIEEVVLDLLYEGYSTGDVDLIFEDQQIYEQILSEATDGRSAAERLVNIKKIRQSRQSDQDAADRILRQKQRKERIQGAVKRVTGAVKGAVGSAVSGARELVDRPARRYAARRELIPSKSGNSKLGTGEEGGRSGIKQKQRSSAGRREVRSRVASDIASRIRSKPGRVASQVGSAVSDAAERAKGGLKGLIRRGAEKVARGAERVASRMATESVDLYDVVLEHLLDEGFADTEEAATVIMANMSEEWRQSIVERKDVIMTVTSPTGKKRSKKRPGATVDSDYHQHENPEQIQNRRFSQILSDRQRNRESEMDAGRLTVATKRGIEKATNRSNDSRVGGNEFAPGSARRRREEDDPHTDYRDRRRRASGR